MKVPSPSCLVQTALGSSLKAFGRELGGAERKTLHREYECVCVGGIHTPHSCKCKSELPPPKKKYQ